MTFELLITILIAGFLLFFIELFIIPGFTVFGIAGVIMIGIGLFYVYSDYGAEVGNYAFIGSLAVCTLTTYLAFKVFKKSNLGLKTVIDSKAHIDNNKALNIGDQGEAFGDIKPKGRARINSEIYNVETEGDFIADGKKVIVIRLESNKIVVKKI